MSVMLGGKIFELGVQINEQRVYRVHTIGEGSKLRLLHRATGTVVAEGFLSENTLCRYIK